MKRIIASVVALSLGACNTTGTGRASTLPTNIEAIITQVRSIADTTCGFLPIADDIAQVILANNSTAQSASAIAGAICKAISTNKSARPGSRVSSVYVTVGRQRVLVRREN